MSEGMSDSTGHAEALLAQVRLLRDKYDALAAANGENFNIFTLLGRETDEVHTHSAVIADLLDPQGSHGQGVAFARLFAPLNGLDDDELKKADVRVEASVNNESRIDILIETDRSCIVIENKIHAGDQDKQLERYHDIAKSRGKTHFRVFYLTLQCDRPSKSSLGDLPEDCVTRVSYGKLVLDWLDDCIKEVALVPQIREILSQYRALVRKLTGKGQRNLTMELKDVLKRAQGDTYNFELAPAIAEALAEVSVEAEWKFWQTLRESLLEPTQSGTSLELDDKVVDAKQVSPDVLRTAHGTSRNRFGYGWNFGVLPELRHVESSTREIRLRVECDGSGWGAFGLIGVERTSDAWRWLPCSDAKELFDRWSPRLAGLGGNWRGGDEWRLGWCYPELDIDLRKTTALGGGVIRTFLHGDAVGPLAAEIRGVVHQLVGMDAAGQS